MKTAKLFLLLVPPLSLLTVFFAAAPTMGQRPPEPVAQPTPAAPPAPTPTPAPTPGAATASTADAKAKAEEKKWDVESPAYPMPIEAKVDTDEGTWMSLDVSPDGREIVFDLLGDIYAFPIGGGEARALTSGVSWDMQPRYSPDGMRIA
ncbi:MAG TPA: amidohydrolase, partial [Thermoanaerobaculia bacterium]|nr:amidohydrolase [Thermoanaerobaculia bacterium]